MRSVFLVANVALGSAQEWASALAVGAKLGRSEADTLGRRSATQARKAFLSRRNNDSNFSPNCPSCASKDFSDLCPLHWQETETSECLAPNTYTGICSRRQQFESMSPSRKLEAERECSFCWPCSEALNKSDETGTCKRHWHLPCPLGYSHQASDADAHRCVKDASGMAPCEAEVSFASLSDKENFATRCSTSWPCEEECENDGYVCPVGWTHFGDGQCAAPSGYNVPGCPRNARFHGWNASMKDSFGVECSVRFPCAAESAVDNKECHSIDVSHCPRGWGYQHGYCEPNVARGRCDQPIRLEKMTLGEKLAWGNSCGVSWPCQGETDIRETTEGQGMKLKDGPIGK